MCICLEKWRILQVWLEDSCCCKQQRSAHRWGSRNRWITFKKQGQLLNNSSFLYRCGKNVKFTIRCKPSVCFRSNYRLITGEKSLFIRHHTVEPDSEVSLVTLTLPRTRQRGGPWPLRAQPWRTVWAPVSVSAANYCRVTMAVRGVFYKPTGALPGIKSSNKTIYSAYRQHGPTAHSVKTEMSDKMCCLVCN